MRASAGKRAPLVYLCFTNGRKKRALFKRLQEDNEDLEYELRLMEGERIYYSWVNTLLLFGMQRQYAVMKSLLRRM